MRTAQMVLVMPTREARRYMGSTVAVLGIRTPTRTKPKSESFQRNWNLSNA
ncbi:hypothetical protein D3C73_1348990 [compost metagenome]